MGIDWESLGKFITTVGIPFAILIIFGWGTYKTIRELIWPYIVDRQKKSDEAKEQERLDRIAERDKFIESMASRDKMMENSIKDVVSSLNILTTEVRKNNGNGRTK